MLNRMLKHFQILTFVLVVITIMSCTRKTQVVSGNYVDREKPTLNYYLPKNGIELNLTLKHTYVFKGPFHDYSYLLKLNDPDFRSTAIENLKIEQVTMKRYSVPDTKNEFSYSWKGNSLPLIHFNDSSIVKEHKMAFNDQLVLFD